MGFLLSWKGWAMLDAVLAVGFSLFVISRRREPSVTLAWVLGFVFIPFLSFFFYLLFGYQSYRRRRRRRPNPARRAEELAAGAAALPMNDDLRNIERLATRVTEFPATAGNRVVIYDHAPDTDAALMEAIRSARRHVHMSYYIVTPDATGRAFRDLLAKKARQGVECRLLMDGVGSFSINDHFLDPLRSAGVKTSFFEPLRFFRRPWTVNGRNHRKLTVIDGVTGFMGSQNIGAHGWRRRFRRLEWRETDAKLEGPVVGQLQAIFVEDWEFSTGERLEGNVYFPPTSSDGRSWAQVVPTGPDGKENALALIFLAAVHTARHRVSVATPYLIPTTAVALALEGAARRGVRVDLLVPRRSDHPIVTWAARSWYAELLDQGVRIHEYHESFLHSKIVTVDGRWGLLGSANMDTRSFLINFEVSLLLYDPPSVRRLEATFDDALKKSEEIQRRTLRRQPAWRSLGESLCRVLSPVL
jgi:cardiolipin synthase